MWTDLKLLGLGLATVMANVAFTPVFAEEAPPLIVEAPAPISKSDPSTQPILGLRAASDSFVDNHIVNAPDASKAEGVFLPEEVVIAAWLRDTNFAKAVRDGHVTTDSIAAIRSSGINPGTFNWATTNMDSSFDPIPVTRDNVTAQVDSTAIIGWTANSVIDLDRRYEVIGEGAQQYALAVSPKYAEGLKMAYRTSELYGQAPLSDSSVEWESPTNLLTVASQRQPILIDSNVKSVGFASYGTIRALNAKEAQLSVDTATAARHDVYLLELVTTLHDLDLQQIHEVFFQTECMHADCVAWELAPFKVGTEVDVETSIKNPEVTIRGVEVGEFFRRTIKYKTLKPTITAYGLREDDFSWSLQGDAIGLGSFSFMVAIGVPKGTTQLRLQQSVRLKTSRFLGLQDNWATTKKSQTIVNLSP